MAKNKDFQLKMEKTVEVLGSQFASVRAGRANASVLDHIVVPYYGVDTPGGPGGQHLLAGCPDAGDSALGQQPLKPIEKAHPVLGSGHQSPK